MKQLLISLLIGVLLSGCATLPHDYYTNPSSAGYTQLHFKIVCAGCRRIFGCSQADYDNGLGYEKCPYCGYNQNLEQGRQAYNYDVEQANMIAAQQAATNMSAQWSNAMAQQQAYDQQQTQNIWDLVHKKKVQGTLTPNAMGGYNFDGKLDN